MKVKCTGVITLLSAPDFPSNGIDICILVLDKMEEKDVDNLYKLMDKGIINITLKGEGK